MRNVEAISDMHARLPHDELRSSPPAPKESAVQQEYDPRGILETVLQEQKIREMRTSQEIKDPQTIGHQDRVGYMVATVAHRLGLPISEAISLTRAAVTHDTHKEDVVGILTPEEKKAIFGAHPVEAADEMAEHDRRAARLISVHHEYQWDAYGAAEPDTDDVSESILALCDQVDALKSPRPNYNKPGWTDIQVIEDENLMKQFGYRMILQALAIWNGEYNRERNVSRVQLKGGAIYEAREKRVAA